MAGSDLAFACSAALTKLEGVTLALVLAAALLAAATAQRGRRGLSGLFLLLAPAAIVPWRLWLAHHELPRLRTDYDSGRLLHPCLSRIESSVSRFGAQHIIEFLFRFDQWLLVLPLAAVALALSMRRLARPHLSLALGRDLVHRLGCRLLDRSARNPVLRQLIGGQSREHPADRLAR